MEEQKRVSKIGLMRQMLEQDFYTKEELVEATGIKHSTANVQLSYHLKQQGYNVIQNEGKYHIVKKEDVSDIEEATSNKLDEERNAEVPEEEGAEPGDAELRRISAAKEDEPATDEDLEDLLNQ